MNKGNWLRRGASLSTGRFGQTIRQQPSKQTTTATARAQAQRLEWPWPKPSTGPGGPTFEPRFRDAVYAVFRQKDWETVERIHSLDPPVHNKQVSSELQHFRVHTCPNSLEITACFCVVQSRSSVQSLQGKAAVSQLLTPLDL